MAAVLELTIRCAMQTFPDRTMSCPAKWTVLQLKQHLHEVCESKPEIARQRLIYAGHCLENSETLEVVLRGRSASNAAATAAAADDAAAAPITPQVIHLMCVSKEQLNNPITNNGIRFRKTATTAPSSQPTTTTPTPVPAPTPTDNLQYGNAFYGYAPLQPQPQNAYEAYAASYQNYVNQMLYYQQQQQFHHMMLQHQQHPNAAPQQFPQQQMLFHPMAAFGAGAGAAAAFGVIQPPHLLQQYNQQQQQQLQGNPLAMAMVPLQGQGPMVAAGAAPEVVAGGGAMMDEQGNERQPDLLDLIYKVVRFSLLAMILYLYSSWERFFVVLAVVAVIWFVQMRRERHNRQEVRRVQPVAVAAPAGVNEGVAAVEGEVQAETATPNQLQQQQQQSAWNVFFSTVVSFFTSMIPENNHGPLNVN